MTSNRQFALAVHILVSLAVSDSGCLNSEVMARSAQANAVSIRRALARFREAGYVSSRAGSGGGTQLTRDPAEITLADVWRIVYADDPVLGLYDGDPDCPVGSQISPLLRGVDDQIRDAVEERLEHTTIAQLAQRITARSTSAPAVA